MAVTTDHQRQTAEELSRTFVEAYNSKTPDRIDDAVTDDFVAHHTGATAEIHGADGYKERIEAINVGFPDFHMEQELMLVDGDMAAARYHWTGTHDGEFMGVPATGKHVDTSSLTLIRMDGDKIAELWVYGDTPGLMRQLGVELGR